MRRSRALAALVLPVALAGCGTTVPLAARAGSAGGPGPVAGPAAATSQGLQLGTSGRPVPAGGASQAAPGVAAGHAGAPAAPQGTVAGALGSYGPGVTDKVMYVGFRVKVNGEQANAAVGAAGISTGDEELNFRILIDDVNAHGGIAGRKVVPVFHKVDASSTETNDEQVRAMCSDWTEDHHVFAATFGADRGLLSCLDKAQAVTAYDNLSTSDAAVFRRFRYYAEISLFSLNRLATAEVAGLAGQGWFSPWDANLGASGGPGTKVGVITYDDPSFHDAVGHDLLPALAAQGHPATSTVFVHVPQSTADLSSLASDVSSAILQFRRAGVEHVIVLDASGTITLLFLNGAQGQRYFPRYGFNSQNAPQLLLTGGDIQSQQLVGSQGIGWFPVLDLRSQDDPESGPDSNNARRRCTDLYRRHQVTFKDSNAAAVSLLTCNSLWFLKAAIERGVSATPGVINRDTFLAGVDALGSSFQSTMTFSTRFGPTQHDGASAYRPFAFDATCGCVRYTGPRTVVP